MLFQLTFYSFIIRWTKQFLQLSIQITTNIRRNAHLPSRNICQFFNFSLLGSRKTDRITQSWIKSEWVNQLICLSGQPIHSQILIGELFKIEYSVQLRWGWSIAGWIFGNLRLISVCWIDTSRHGTKILHSEIYPALLSFSVLAFVLLFSFSFLSA